MQELPRKRKTLEAKRAVVLEKPEKAAATLLQQLNAIRNAKAEKRRQASNRWGWVPSGGRAWRVGWKAGEGGGAFLRHTQR